MTFPGSMRSRSGRTMRAWPALLSAVFVLAACGSHSVAGQRTSDHGRPAAARGALVSSTSLAVLDTAAARAAVRGAGFDYRHARYGVRAYKIVYRTPDLRGRMTTASGVVALPRNGRTHWPLVSYTHGTTTYRPDVASRWNDDYATAPAVMYASAGFVAALPDYLGLGDGPGVHPWMHLATQTSAS